jgi:hypothetical protein
MGLGGSVCLELLDILILARVGANSLLDLFFDSKRMLCSVSAENVVMLVPHQHLDGFQSTRVCHDSLTANLYRVAMFYGHCMTILSPLL